jgi:uncharacterized protein (DUF849 family)
MLLKVALNGARQETENVNIPHSIEEIVNQAGSVYRLGYKVFHIHCYNKNKQESLVPEDVNILVTSVKNIADHIQIGISTGDWIEPDLNKRLDYIKNWSAVPDFASVNLIEDNAADVCKALINKGVMIEAGLNELKAAEIFINSGIDEHCIRVLIEPEEETYEGAVKTVDQIENVLNSNNCTIKRLLHGYNATSWPLLFEAKKRGYDSRMGLEDTIYDKSGRQIKDNIELIKTLESVF